MKYVIYDEDDHTFYADDRKVWTHLERASHMEWGEAQKLAETFSGWWVNNVVVMPVDVAKVIES